MEYIIPIMVGSLIGYVTNWLAIKMLFRPYKEKYILGIKVPFTPGVIPKEKSRIARSIGNTVEHHLLTPEKLNENIKSNEFKEKIYKVLLNYFQRIKTNNISIGNKITKVFKHELILSRIYITLLNFINENEEKIIKLINNYYNDIILKYSDKIDFDLYIEQFLTNNNFKNTIIKSITDSLKDKKHEDCIISDFISVQNQEKIKKYLYNNNYKIHKHIKDFLEDKDNEKEIKRIITEISQENSGMLIRTLVNSEYISDKVYSKILSYLNTEKSVIDVGNISIKLVDRICNLNYNDSIKFIENFISKDMKIGIYDKIVSLLIKSKDYRNTNSGKDLIIYRLKDINVGEKIYNYLLNVFINEKEVINTRIDYFLKKTYKIKIYKILEYFNLYDEYNLRLVINNCINKIDLFYLTRILKLINISDIVEQQINEFDLKFTEDLIIDIAGKELNMITNLGAVLGGIIGFLSILI